ncbi:MAG: hypothetical protein AB8B87_00135 [Granulosicoccus sp.]
MSIRIVILIICVVVTDMTTSRANSEPVTKPTRAGYSFFGLGVNFIDYEENSAQRVDGRIVDVETASMVNVAQQSGTYVSFSNEWGFYLITSSTLGESQSEESWVVDDAIIRTNKILFEQQRIGLLLSKHLKSDYYYLFGAQYNNTEFRRFGTTLTPAATDFGLTAESANLGTESETVLDLAAVAGLEKTTVFMSDQPGWRYQFQAVLGLPLLTNISNTEINDGEKFGEGFSGLFGQGRFNYGYQFNKNIFLSLNLEIAVSQRNAIDREISDSVRTTEFPSNTLVYFFPSLSLYWSF